MPPVIMTEENLNNIRPYTLFYYPSSLLPPRALRQVGLCRFWCMLDVEGEVAFTAEASLKWEVEQLAKAILQEKKDLRKLKTSQIVLLKLNEPILVDPEETLLQRLPKSITDFSVKLRRTELVSNAFPNPPSMKHLQIIVMLQEEAGVQISSSSTPPSGSTTLGHATEMGSTGTPHRQAARVSRRRKGPSQKQSNTHSAPPTDPAPPRRSPRNHK